MRQVITFYSYLVMERLVMWGLRVMGTRSRGHAEQETPSLGG